MGGRGSTSGISVGGGAGGGPAVFQIQQQPPNIAPTPQMAQQLNSRTFDATDDRDFHELTGGRNYFLSQNLTIDQQIAVINYLASDTETGSLYSMSQNLNHALATGQALTANQQYVYNQLMGAMHNTGENLVLTRYDHSAVINRLLGNNGLRQGYEHYTEAQLKQALVGQTFGENKFLSTSYNDFRHAPQSSKDTFASRAVKITYRTSAGVQSMMPGNGPGGQLGEIILAPSGGRNNMKVVDVRFTGSKARVKGTQSYSLPQVELVVEVT